LTLIFHFILRLFAKAAAAPTSAVFSSQRAERELELNSRPGTSCDVLVVGVLQHEVLYTKKIQMQQLFAFPLQFTDVGFRNAVVQTLRV
jgi:hypothetical protein